MSSPQEIERLVVEFSETRARVQELTRLLELAGHGWKNKTCTCAFCVAESVSPFPCPTVIVKGRRDPSDADTESRAQLYDTVMRGVAGPFDPGCCAR